MAPMEQEDGTSSTPGDLFNVLVTNFVGQVGNLRPIGNRPYNISDSE